MKKNNLTALIAVEKDRNALTIGLMSRMKLHGMATESLPPTIAETMTIDSFLHMLLAKEWDYRECSHPTPYTRSGVPLQDMS